MNASAVELFGMKCDSFFKKDLFKCRKNISKNERIPHREQIERNERDSNGWCKNLYIYLIKIDYNYYNGNAKKQQQQNYMNK